MKINVQIEVPDDLHHAVDKYATVLGISSDVASKLVTDATLYALGRIANGLPLAGSLRSSLELDSDLRREFSKRNDRDFMSLEQAVMESIAINAAVKMAAAKLNSGATAKRPFET